MVQIEQIGAKVRETVRPWVKPVLVVFGLIMLGMLAILRANFSYVDDLGRAAEGYKGWGNFSRYLSNVLAMILHGNGFLTDISPWSQIVAALVMAVAGVMLLYIIYGRKKFRWWELGAVTILALNPYFLEGLSYKFDAPFIAIAVLAMIVPFLARKEKAGPYAGAVLVGTLVTCTTYQAALGVLPMITVVLAFREWGRGGSWKKVGEFVGLTALGYVLGLVIFRVFLMKTVDAYVTTMMPGIGGLIPQVMQNLRQYYELVMTDFAKTWLVLIGVVGVGFVVMMTLEMERKKWLAVIGVLLGTGILGMMCFGIYVMMVQPLFEPRAMLGFGVMLSLMVVVVVEERKLEKNWQKCVWGVGTVASVVLAYVLGTFSLTYGNALATQKEYTEFRIEMVIAGLEEEVQEGETVRVAGTIGLAPALQRAAEKYPVLERLVPVEFEGGYWGQYKFLRYYGMEDLTGEMMEVPKVEDYPIVKESWHYNLRRRGGEVVVELR